MLYFNFFVTNLSKNNNYGIMVLKFDFYLLNYTWSAVSHHLLYQLKYLNARCIHVIGEYMALYIFIYTLDTHTYGFHFRNDNFFIF